MSAPLADNHKPQLAVEHEDDVISKSSEELDFWINCIGAPLLVVEKQMLVVRCGNRAAQTFFGLNATSFVQTPIETIIGDGAMRMLSQIWSNAPVGVPGEPFLVRSAVQGQERLLMVQVSKLVVEGEALRLFTFTDAPPKGSVALAGWQETIIDMLNWLPFGFEIASTDDQIQFANSEFNTLFGYSPDQIESIEDWWRLAYPDPQYRQFARSQWETSIAAARLENREMTPFDLDVTTARGTQRTIQFRHRTINNFNVNLYLDVTRERAYARDLKILSETDPLTGAMNRRSFFQEAARFYADPPSPALAVLMLDLDHFKHINDTHGHGTGDRVLVEFTERCRNAIRASDVVARLGGEEFGILMPVQDAQEAMVIAERVCAATRMPLFTCGGNEIPVSVSIGLAMRFPEEASVEPTLARADRALYAAKNAGRDRIALYW